MSLVKLIHIIGRLKTCLWHVGGRRGRQKEKTEVCILCNPGRSIKLEAVRERFLIDLFKFRFALNHASGGGTCVRGCGKEPACPSCGSLLTWPNVLRTP